MSSDNTISINKYIANTGMCSRREADRLIEDGRVKINGRIAEKGNRVTDSDSVKIGSKLLKVPQQKKLYIALNKPKGIVSTTDKKEKQNIVDYIHHPQRLYPIGRLDKLSEGLILMTNDGDIVNKILRAGNEHSKEYIVTVDHEIDEKFINKMSGGIPILGTRTNKCEVQMLNAHTFKIILTQGLNRQIRRMCEYLGYKVTKLKRVRIMHITLGRLATGQWRELTPSETEILLDAVKQSSKTASTSIQKRKAK